MQCQALPHAAGKRPNLLFPLWLQVNCRKKLLYTLRRIGLRQALDSPHILKEFLNPKGWIHTQMLRHIADIGKIFLPFFPYVNITV